MFFVWEFVRPVLCVFMSYLHVVCIQLAHICICKISTNLKHRLLMCTQLLGKYSTLVALSCHCYVPCNLAHTVLSKTTVVVVHSENTCHCVSSTNQSSQNTADVANSKCMYVGSANPCCCHIVGTANARELLVVGLCSQWLFKRPLISPALPVAVHVPANGLVCVSYVTHCCWVCSTGFVATY